MMVRPHHHDDDYQEHVKQPVVAVAAVQKRSLFQTSNEGRRKKEEAACLKMNDATEKQMIAMDIDSNLFGLQEDEEEGRGTHGAASGGAVGGGGIVVVPRFETNEIELETTVGMGEFGIIHKINAIWCFDDDNTNTYPQDDDLEAEEEKASKKQQEERRLRQHLAHHFDHHRLLDQTRRYHLRKRSCSSGALSTGALSATTLDTESSNSTLTLDQSAIIEVTMDNNSNNSNTAIVCPAAPPLVSPSFNDCSFCCDTPTSGGTNPTNDGGDDDDNNGEGGGGGGSTSKINGSNLFVIKHIRKDLYPNKKIEAAIALASEAKFLLRLQQLYNNSSSSSNNTDDDYYSNNSNHPNLISLRGIVSDPGTPNFGIILDRLNLTLTEIATSWSVQQAQLVEKYSIKHPHHHFHHYHNHNSKNKKSSSTVSSSSSSSKNATRISQSTLLPQHRRAASMYTTSTLAAKASSSSSSSWVTELTSWFRGTSNSILSDDVASRSFSSSAQHQQQEYQQQGQLSSSSTTANLLSSQQQQQDHHRRTPARMRSTISLSTSGYSSEAILLLGERVLALYDVSEGMKFLHSHRILFRDLKSENICSYSGTSFTTTTAVTKEKPKETPPTTHHHHHQRRMQIFDFGLARECKLTDRVLLRQNDTNDDGNTQNNARSSSSSSFYDTYRMTGLTGTLRIMAPEVIECLPYGLPADVYSFGMCMWEVFEGTRCNFLSPAEICSGNSSGIRATRRSTSIRPAIPASYFNDDTEYDGNNNNIDIPADNCSSCCSNNSNDRSTCDNNRNKTESADNNNNSNTIGIGMPKQLQQLVQRCWNDDPYQRPTFDEISHQLKLLLSELLYFHKHERKKNRHKNKNKDNATHKHHTLPSLSTSSSSSPSSSSDTVVAAKVSAEEAFWYRLQTIHSS